MGIAPDPQAGLPGCVGGLWYRGSDGLAHFHGHTNCLLIMAVATNNAPLSFLRFFLKISFAAFACLLVARGAAFRLDDQP